MFETDIPVSPYEISPHPILILKCSSFETLQKFKLNSLKKHLGFLFHLQQVSSHYFLWQCFRQSVSGLSSFPMILYFNFGTLKRTQAHWHLGKIYTLYIQVERCQLPRARNPWWRWSLGESLFRHENSLESLRVSPRASGGYLPVPQLQIKCTDRNRDGGR